MKYVLINDEGLDLGNKNLVELETIEVTADDPTSAVLTILGEQKRRLIVTKYGRAPGVWLVRDDDKEAYGLSLIVVERGEVEQKRRIIEIPVGDIPAKILPSLWKRWPRILGGKARRMIKRTEQGWAGHFCCAHDCLFRRNTLLERGKRHVIVSTVGNMNHREIQVGGISNDKQQEIGCGRHYETMVFHARFEKPYWEADVHKEVNFDSPCSIKGIKRDSDFKANEMHEVVVKEIMEKMEKGKIK